MTGTTESGHAGPRLRAERLRIPGGVTWHSHTELQWMAVKQGIVVLETAGGHWLGLPGQALLVGSHVPHAVHLHGTAEMYSLYIEPGTLSLDERSECELMAVSPLLDAAVVALVAEASRRSTRARERAGLLEQLILGDLTTGRVSLYGLANPDNRALRSLSHRLRADPAEASGIDECARIVRMSRRTFTRRFRQEVGLSFVEWRRRLRVFHALRLRAENVPTKQIAHLCGFRSTQALYGEIRKELGITLKTTGV